MVKNGKIPQDQWTMTCDPLFDCIFREDFESVLGLVKFGHFTGQIDVKPVFRGQKRQSHHRFMNYDMWPLVRLHCSRGFRLVKFGQIIGQMHVNPARQLVRNGEVPQVTWIMSCGALLHCVFEEDYESVLNLTLSGQFAGKMHVKSVYSQEKK